ncbi:hypothetical protein [Radicibacter daui]|uniref:hypothetical protein n=1 Tax=Radicibacter daui TaxID=3064829 RepID=UPI0040469E01
MTAAAPATGRRFFAASGLANGLCLAATPAFALMALITWHYGGAMEMICSGGQGIFSPGSMVTMYALMSFFHLTPWLRLLRRPGT